MKNNKDLENPERSQTRNKSVIKDEEKNPCEVVHYVAQEVVIEQNENEELKIPACPKCGSNKYMIRRSAFFSIEKDRNPWFCVKCTQKRLLIYDTDKDVRDEIAHLEGKIPSFECDGEILQLDPKTRQYKTIGKIEN